MGENPPTHAQNPAASCPPAPASCNYVNNYLSSTPNTNILYGALVEGNGFSDNFVVRPGSPTRQHPMSLNHNGGGGHPSCWKHCRLSGWRVCAGRAVAERHPRGDPEQCGLHGPAGQHAVCAWHLGAVPPGLWRAQQGQLHLLSVRSGPHSAARCQIVTVLPFLLCTPHFIHFMPVSLGTTPLHAVVGKEV